MISLKSQLRSAILLTLIVVAALTYGSPVAAAPFYISTVAGGNGWGYSGDGGQATAAKIQGAEGLVADGNGNFYIADAFAHVVRKVSSSGVISTYAGTSVSGFSGDAGQATSAQLNTPRGLALDTLGNLYIADEGNNRVRKVATNGVITTVAGTGTGAYGGDSGQATAAQLYGPSDVDFDLSGNMYISDRWNQRVRKVATNGVITTVAGNGTSGFGGDSGAATSAKIWEPRSIAVDAGGNLYIADYRNNRIRKVTSGGTISTVAGNGTAGYAGDGGAATSAELNGPVGVATDLNGSLIIADTGSNAIREVSAGSTAIFTLVGTGTASDTGDGGPANVATINDSESVFVDATNNLYVGESSGHAVRFVPLGASNGSVVSATIDPSFTFAVANNASACNGESNFRSGGSATAVALGHLAAGANVSAGQTLTVASNAGGGFTVFVRGSQASQNLRSVGHNWADVAGTYGSPAALGAGEHFGYTYADSTAASSVANPGSALFIALDLTDRAVMGSASSPSGNGCVSYDAQAAATTPAASYSATVIYSAVPTF